MVLKLKSHIIYFFLIFQNVILISKLKRMMILCSDLDLVVDNLKTKLKQLVQIQKREEEDLLICSKRLALFECTEQISASFAARVETAMHTHSVQFLKTSAVELEHFEAGRDVPNVDEGNFSELATPFSGDADSTAQRGDHIAQLFPAVEALVRVGPHAVHGMDTFGFGEDILEADLQVVIDVVRITVHEIDFCHGGRFVFS